MERSLGQRADCLGRAYMILCRCVAKSASAAPTPVTRTSPMSHATDLDLLLVNPGGRDIVYQDLGADLAAIEPPLWCGLIATYTRKRGISVRILDAEAEGLGPARTAERVQALRPRLVAMIVFGHQPSASTQMMSAAGETCRRIKSLDPAQPILIVGGHVSALPERTLREEAVDFACTGEGPVTIEHLLPLLRAGRTDWAGVPGLMYRRPDGVPVQNPRAPNIANLDADLDGSAWDLLPMDKYRAHNWQCFGDLSRRQPYASIYTSLGCPYKCTFCCINAPFGTNGYRMRSPGGVVDEMELLYRTYGVRTFKIVDEMFVLNPRHVNGVCTELVNRGFSHDVNIWAYARVDTVKPDMLSLLRRAGFRWLALGIESGSKHVRDGAQKALKSDDIVSIVRAIQAADINVIGNYIFGLPDDDLQTMQETLQLALELNCEFSNFYSAMAYPGSPLYSMAVAKGWDLPERWSGFSQHSYDCKPLPTEKVSAAAVLAFRDEAFHTYFGSPRYLNMISERFDAQTRAHIEKMAAHRLRRRLLETPDAPAQCGQARSANT
jgi:radical SAM superfamily enzyme YgiQ (UPF0313 family)